MEQRNSKLGLSFFAIYLLLYGGFVFLNAFFPKTMETMPLEGINLAILYGFGLIVAAFVMALVYGFLCQTTDESTSENGGDKEGSR